jgi:hypothetical protein
MFKRKRKTDDAAGTAAGADGDHTASLPEAPPEPEPEPEAQPETEMAPAMEMAPDPERALEMEPEPDRVEEPVGGPRPGRGPMATAPPPPVFGDQPLTAGFWVESVQGVLSKAPHPTADDLERQAAADFQAAIMPGLLGLRDAVPDAASPDDAMRALAEREAEYEFPADPDADSVKANDIFGKDATVYYRIRNHFERPRRKVGWGNPWRPPPGLAKPDPPTRRALNRG